MLENPVFAQIITYMQKSHLHIGRILDRYLPQELLELVRLLWLNPVVVVGGVPPRVNCTLGGESWHISGIGGADTLRVAVRCLVAGDLGLARGLTRACFRTPPGLCSGRSPLMPPASLSSGRGPRVEPPEAELIPDIAETESPDRLLERTKLA